MLRYRILKFVGLLVFGAQLVVLMSRCRVEEEDFVRAGTRVKNGGVMVAEFVKDKYHGVETRVRDAMDRD